MTKLCFGGTFNPIHAGHLLIARAVAETLGFERVVLIPSSVPPHKTDSAELAAGCHRLAMCQLVAQGDAFFEVDDLELRRSGPSYTIDTVRELNGRGWAKVSWLVGADMVQILPKWHRPLELIAEAELVIAQRPGCEIDWGGLGAMFQGLRDHVVRAPLLEISASDIRQRIRDGRPIRYLVPEAVERYIFEHHLYR